MKETDHKQRVSTWLQEHASQRDEIFDRMFFSYEAWFHLNGYVNNQNTQICATSNPYHMQEQTLHDVRVWCAVSRHTSLAQSFLQKQ